MIPDNCPDCFGAETSEGCLRCNGTGEICRVCGEASDCCGCDEPEEIRNRCFCKLCGDIIESKTRHDFVACKCGAIFTDGGRDYVRRGWKGGMAVEDCIEDIGDDDAKAVRLSVKFKEDLEKSAETYLRAKETKP